MRLDNIRVFTEKLQEKSFLLVAFLLGWTAIYGNVICFIMLALLLFNIKSDLSFFTQSVKREKYYLLLPCVFFLYMLGHTVISRFLVGDGVKPSYGIFETLILFFIVIPLYVLSMKKWMTASLLRRGMLFFCIGVLVFSIAALFQLTGKSIFTDTLNVLDAVYQGRFGGNKTSIFGGFMMLEAQAMVLGVASVMSFFLVLFNRRSLGRIILTLLLLLFLSFTVTKAAILGFLAGALIGCVYIFKKFAFREKRNILICIAILLVLGIYFMPQGYVNRFQEISVEIDNIKNGQLTGGSLAPRIAMWREVKNHAGEFALCGVGVYYKEVVKTWFDASPDHIAGMTNVHNSFLEYWIKGGILGLLLVISLFLFPIVKMVKKRHISFWVIAGLIAIFIPSNTCVLFVHVNSLAIIMFLLSMFYFYSDDFWEMETNVNRSN